jgi:uncharacterized protein (DUF2147 family)
MKKNISLLIALFMTVLAMAQKSTDNFTGRWKTAEGTIIEINKSGLAFMGKPQGKNVVVLKDLVFTGEKWKGTLSNPKKNKSANCEAYLEGNKIRFVVKKGMMKKEIFWLKTN